MKKDVFIGLVVIVLCIGALGMIIAISMGASSRSPNIRDASLSLLTIVTAQKYFRDNDIDEDGISNYWRKDIAGLYALEPAGRPAIKLIEISIAQADDRPVMPIIKGTRGPKAGYWYRALRFAGENTPDPNRFAVCAFPNNPEVDRTTYIIDHKGIRYKKMDVPRDMEIYPDNPIKEGWEKMD